MDNQNSERNLPPNQAKAKSKALARILILGGSAMLLMAGPLQPRLLAMRTEEGIYIPNSHYRLSDEEREQVGKTVSHNFTIYNGRPHPVKVKAAADCGCTGLSWNQTTILPFGQATIVASKKVSRNSSTVGLTFGVNQDDYIFATIKE